MEHVWKRYVHKKRLLYVHRKKEYNVRWRYTRAIGPGGGPPERVHKVRVLVAAQRAKASKRFSPRLVCDSLSLSLSLGGSGAQPDWGRTRAEQRLPRHLSSSSLTLASLLSMPAACLWLGASAALGIRVSKHTDCSFDFDLFLLNRTFRCFSVCLFVCLLACLFACLFLPFWSAPTDRQTAKKTGSPVLLLLRLLPAGSVGHELLSFVRVLCCCYQ